jgi:hypothetical protein
MVWKLRGFGLLLIRNAPRVLVWPAYTVLKSISMFGYYMVVLLGIMMKRAFYNDVATT